MIMVAQNDTVRYNVSFSGLTSSGDYAPFWMQNQQYGKVSSSPHSVGVTVGIKKRFQSSTQMVRL